MSAPVSVSPSTTNVPPRELNDTRNVSADHTAYSEKSSDSPCVHGNDSTEPPLDADHPENVNPARVGVPGDDIDAPTNVVTSVFTGLKAPPSSTSVTVNVASTVTIDADEADAGPVLPAASDTEPDFRLNTTLPSDVHVTVTVNDDPDDPDTLDTEHDAAPDCVPNSKSDVANPDTDSANPNEYDNERDNDGDDGPVNPVTDGAVPSRTTESSADVGATSTLPAASVARVYT